MQGAFVAVEEPSEDARTAAQQVLDDVRAEVLGPRGMNAAAGAVATAFGEPVAGGHGHSEMRGKVLAGLAQGNVED
eukprot:6046261-Pyramimonas_sp.AAC.1